MVFHTLNELIQIDRLNKPKTELVQLTKQDYIRLMDRMIQQIENREFLDNYLETIRRLEK